MPDIKSLCLSIKKNQTHSRNEHNTNSVGTVDTIVVDSEWFIIHSLIGTAWPGTAGP